MKPGKYIKDKNTSGYVEINDASGTRLFGKFFKLNMSGRFSQIDSVDKLFLKDWHEWQGPFESEQAIMQALKVNKVLH